MGHRLHVRNADEEIEWYTPPSVFEALGLTFDLDPCAPAGGVPWIPAKHHYTTAEDGLIQPWSGRVWLNPPYGSTTATWLNRLAAHGDGLALVFARTDTAWFHEIVPTTAAMCFVSGRLRFVKPDGTTPLVNAGAPSVLLAWGDTCATALIDSGLGLVFSSGSLVYTGQRALWDVS